MVVVRGARHAAAAGARGLWVRRVRAGAHRGAAVPVHRVPRHGSVQRLRAGPRGGPRAAQVQDAAGSRLRASGARRGGFAGPQRRLEILVAETPEGPRLFCRNNARSAIHTAPLDGTAMRDLVSNVFAALQACPVEEPRFGEDIYGQDTCIRVHWGEVTWWNGAPGGCVRQSSSNQPTAAQVTAFKQCVDRIRQFAAAAQPLQPLPAESKGRLVQLGQKLSIPQCFP